MPIEWDSLLRASAYRSVGVAITEAVCHCRYGVVQEMGRSNRVTSLYKDNDPAINLKLHFEAIYDRLLLLCIVLLLGYD